MIIYLFITHVNYYQSLHSSYSSQSIIALIKPLFFSLSIMLASVKKPQIEQSIYSSIQNNSNITITDVDNVPCDPVDLLPWHDFIAKTALQDLLAMTDKHRFYH